MTATSSFSYNTSKSSMLVGLPPAAVQSNVSCLFLVHDLATNWKSSVKNSASRLEALFTKPTCHAFHASATEDIRIPPVSKMARLYYSETSLSNPDSPAITFQSSRPSSIPARQTDGSIRIFQDVSEMRLKNLGIFLRKDENPLSILPSFQGIILNYALSFTGVTVISHIPIMGNIKSRNLSISSVSTNMK